MDQRCKGGEVPTVNQSWTEVKAVKADFTQKTVATGEG